MALSLLLIFTVTLTASAQSAQPAGNGWARVQTLAVSTSIRVKAKKTVVCKFQSATADALRCLTNGKTDVQEFPLAEIRYVKVPHRLRSALVGAIPGAAIALGGGIGVATANCSKVTLFCGFTGAIIAAFGAVLILIGLGAGAAADFSATTLYERQQDVK